MFFQKPNQPQGNDTLGWRIASASVALPLVVLILLLGFPWLHIGIVLITILGVLEYYRLLKEKIQPSRAVLLLGLLLALLFVALGYRNNSDLVVFVALAALVPLGMLLLVVWRIGRFHSWVLLSLGPLYLGYTLSYALLIDHLYMGTYWLALALAATFATDSTAYFVGRTLGHTPLAPAISPGKTREGAVAGMLGAITATITLTFLWDLGMGPLKAAFLGLGIGIVCQIGDLLESSLKRYSNVKDAGSLIPGHGGVLDRLDSVVPSLVLVYYGARWVTS